jgi:hypothetical protein
MKPFYAVLPVFFICINAAAQTVAPQTMAMGNVDVQPLGYVTTFAGPPPRTEGTSYLYDYFTTSSVLLHDNKMIKDVATKIDLQNNLVEMQYNGLIKVLEFDRLKAIDILLPNGQVEHAVTAKSLKFSGTPKGGLFRFVKSGTYNLLVVTQIEKIAPTYNVALNVGSKDYELVKRNYYFIMKDGFAVPVEKAKKKFSSDLKAAFGEDFEKKLEKVKTNKENSLVEFVDSLNASAM